MQTRSATRKSVSGNFDIIQLRTLTNVKDRIETAILASRGAREEDTLLGVVPEDETSDWEDDVSVCSAPQTPLSRPSTPLSEFEVVESETKEITGKDGSLEASLVEDIYAQGYVESTLSQSGRLRITDIAVRTDHSCQTE
jgi:hypothetical protein